MEALIVQRAPVEQIGLAQQRERDCWRREVDLLSDLLEMNGAGAMARPRAERLLQRAGNLSAALSSGLGRLLALGASDCEIRTLRLIQNAVALSLRRRAVQRVSLKSLSAVIDYLHADMANREHEIVRCLLLSGNNELIHDEVLHRGNVMSVELHPRRVAQVALEHGAAAVILAHNHPSGDPTPSREDQHITLAVQRALQTIGILLHDHIIVARAGHSSMKSLGMIDRP